MKSQPITNVLSAVEKDEIIVKGESSPAAPQGNRRKRKRRVAFDDRVRIFEIHIRIEYTNDEVRACWYSPSELQLFRSQTAFLKNNTEEDYGARGAEHLTKLRSFVNARLKGLPDEAEAASDHRKGAGSSRIVRSLWKGWLFQQKEADMSKTSSKNNANRRHQRVSPHQ
jgi:hypothetical protein